MGQSGTRDARVKLDMVSRGSNSEVVRQDPEGLRRVRIMSTKHEATKGTKELGTRPY